MSLQKMIPVFVIFKGPQITKLDYPILADYGLEGYEQICLSHWID